MIPTIYKSNKFPLIRGNSYRVTDIKKTVYGYIIKRISDYVSKQNVKLHVLDNGFSYAIVKVDTNYQAPYQYRLYFDAQGNEIKSDTNSTRLEKKQWLKLQNETI